MSKISRRDFLKVYATLMASATFSRASKFLSSVQPANSNKPNILIFVFDAMSARHLSLYGYARRTTPNLQKFADRASVYHRHYSVGNFTTTGTASMLTGLNPWTHRAITYRGMIDHTITDRNLFHLMGDEYTRLAFTQNLWADILLSQFGKDLDYHLPCDTYSNSRFSLFEPDDIPGDRAIAYYAFQDFLNLRTMEPHPFPGSLSIGTLELAKALTASEDNPSIDYPRGLPTVYEFSYENAVVFAELGRLIQSSLQSPPFLGYFHLWSPHGPYNAQRDFVGIFQDHLEVPSKPPHSLSGSNYPEARLRDFRREYDEYIANVDAEFGQLMNGLEDAGVLQNSYVIVTSDHGELFERGELSHASALMYAPVTHIPLLISAPGQQTRSDFHSSTSNLDLLPTLLQIADKEIPDWIEGKLLPGFGGIEDNSRGIFPLVAKDNAAFRPIEHATFTLIKGPYELFFFTGYPGHPDGFELYNLEEDPDELQDLFRKDITAASQMKDELLEAVHAANRNYQTK